MILSYNNKLDNSKTMIIIIISIAYEISFDLQKLLNRNFYHSFIITIIDDCMEIVFHENSSLTKAIYSTYFSHTLFLNFGIAKAYFTASL